MRHCYVGTCLGVDKAGSVAVGELGEDMIREGEAGCLDLMNGKGLICWFCLQVFVKEDATGAQVVGHQLTHSRTGNLITNKNNEHIWLNEFKPIETEALIDLLKANIPGIENQIDLILLTEGTGIHLDVYEPDSSVYKLIVTGK
ncbi:hypothetical protein RJT34_07731 [Clitoria ternatea]|uniref:Uncharacterized protein n=1 Tax=Clitoria ternatea TaxID=43366 RepID=A0AAN9K3Q8_CLITE